MSSSIQRAAVCVVGVGVELADSLFRVSGCRHLAEGVDVAEQLEQVATSLGVETFFGHRQRTATPIEGVGPAAAMSEGLLLDAPTALLELHRGVTHHAERVDDQRGGGHAALEDAAIGGREVEGRGPHLLAPSGTSILQPLSWLRSTATRNDVEELAEADVGDDGDEVPAAPLAVAHEEVLVESQAPDLSDASRVVDEQLAELSDGVIHGVPVTPELAGHLGNAATVGPYLERRPATGSRRHGVTERGHVGVLLRPAALGTRLFETAPATLAPREVRRRPRDGQVHELQGAAILHPSEHSARRTTNGDRGRFDVHDEELIAPLQVHDDDSGQLNERVTARAVSLRVHGGSSDL